MATKLTSDINSILLESGPEPRSIVGQVEHDSQTISVLREQLAEMCRQSMDILAGTAMPDTCTLMFPPTFLAIWQLLAGSADKPAGFDRLAIGIPRGFTKTTVMKLFVLYCILFTERNFILVVCRTARLAENFLSDVADMLDDPNIKATFGDWRLNLEQDTQGQKKFSFRGRNLVLAAIGADGSVRGINVKNRRPDVILMDDMQSWDNAASPVLSDELLTWMTGTLMKAASKFRCLYVFVGNMYPFPGSILRKLKQNKAWTSFIAGGLLADGESIWPELQSKEQLLLEYENDLAMGKPEIFLAEVLNDDTASGKSGVDVTQLKPCAADLLNDLPQGKFIIIDPANDKKHSDSTEIIYFEIFDEIPVAVERICGQLSPGDCIKFALQLAIRRNCKLIAVESVAYQYSLLYWFNQIATQFNIVGIEFVELYTKGMRKNSRIKDMLGLLMTGKLLVAEQLFNAVIYQIVHWNPLKTDNVDDLLDVLAYAYQVIDQYGHMIAEQSFYDINHGHLQEGVLQLEDNSAF